jgi:predicted DNA-binding transcriptional regulator YafY
MLLVGLRFRVVVRPGYFHELPQLGLVPSCDFEHLLLVHARSVDANEDSIRPIIFGKEMDLSIGRVLTLLELLQAYRRLSAAEIGRRLEVDGRTVRRYVAGLQEMGIPVESVRGRAGGYRLRPGFKIPPLMFTNEEALVIVLGLLSVQRLGLVTDPTAVQGAMAKLNRVLPDGLRARVQAMQETLGLGLNTVAHGSADAASVLTLATAARDGQRVRLRYRSASKEETERLVDPYGVAFQSGEWYVVAWDHLRQALRSFRLDRVLAAEVTREAFEKPAGFDAVAHIQDTLASLPYPWFAEVILELPLTEAKRRVPRSLGIVTATPDGVLLRLGADDLNWAARYLSGLGCSFTVVSPPELRPALLRQADLLTQAAAG